ncbi:MAG: CHAT domain-containing protein, partial [Anaerolineae bacterium]
YLGERGQWPEGEADARQALASARRLQDVDLELAALDLLGRACEEQERLEEAEGWYAQALDRAREVHHRAEEAGALLHLGIVRARRNRAADARATLTAALEAAAALGLTYLRYYAHYHLGLLCASAPDGLPEALGHFRAAVALLEEERAALRPVEAFERRYVAGRQNLYRLAAGTAFRLGRPLEALEMLEQGRARGLARRLLLREALPPAVPEELRERYARAFQTVQALRNRVYGEPGWGARLMEDVRLGLAMLDRAGSEEEFEALVAQARAQEEAQRRQALAEAEAELEKVTRRVRACAPDFELQVDLPPLDWDAITAEPTTAVVALFVGDETGRAVLLHSSGLRTVDLPGLRRAEVERLLYGLPEPLARALEQFRRQPAREPDWMGSAALAMHYLTLRWMIEQAPSPNLGWQVALHTLISEKREADDLRRIRRRLALPPPEKTLFDLEDDQRLSLWHHLLEEMAAELRARLWQPLLPLLRELGVTQVVLVPDADLHALPLALGLADEADAPAVALAPTLRLYAQCRRRLQEREPRQDTLMLIANPTGDLPAAEVEAGLLRDLFAAHGRATFVLSGDQATPASLIRTARVGNYWHFAGHARYEGWNPALSALHLANGEHLPLFLVPIGLDLRATRLAVLSACETAITPARDPAQEFEGLFTAFLAAGAPAVLASLWPVEELATALLMARFYEVLLQEGKPPAQALRDAQRWLRALPADDALRHLRVTARHQNPPRSHPLWAQLLALENGVEYPYANPYFWAGFMLAGV